MNKVKLRFITLLSIAMLVALVLGSVFGTANLKKSFAASTDYSPTAIFSQGTGGDVKAYKENKDEEAYVAFEMRNEGEVYYRRDLALKWFAKGENGEAAAQYFHLDFSFLNVEFSTFEIVFESGEENFTKDGKTSNAIVFEKEGTDFRAYVRNSSDEESGKVTIGMDISLSFDETDCSIGEFRVLIGNTVIGKFTNVGGYYLEYRSSASSTPNTPMTFKITMPDDAKDDVKQKVLVKKLNGQSLAVKEGTDGAEPETDGTVLVTGGNVKDDTPPVLVLNGQVYAFTLGQRFSLTYEAIDVCKDSVSVSRYYYVLKYKDGKPVEPELDGATAEYKYSSLTTSTFFMPTGDDNEEEVEYLSIRFYLDDGIPTSDENPRQYVYLDWYAAESAVEKKGELNYIRADLEKEGPEYIGVTADKDATDEADKVNRIEDREKYDAAVKAYADAVEEAAKNVSAGDGSYFYLPSLRGLIASDYADYRDLRFNIYYYKESQSEGASATSATSLRYNALRFEIKEAGKYRFRIMATDASNNSMQYYLDGELVTVSSTNIWDIDEIPEFSFIAKYNGATIEEAGEQTQGYRDSSYSISDFKVIALDGIEEAYALYFFDEAKARELQIEIPTYSDLVKNAADYFDKEGNPLEKYKDVIRRINEFNDEIGEDDDEWENTDNAYHWDPDSSLSFVPKVSGFYFVKLTVTDPSRTNEKTIAYQVVQVSNPYDYTPGQSQWLRNNIVSVVLFSISGVLLVVIVILAVVKPSEQNVEEIDLEKLKGKKKKKN